ncbi:MAG TPA: aminomethyl-transferring glycine dehydrogenase subunit GcvPA [Waddliaceae bacterium]
MDFVSNQEPQLREMLNAIGIGSVDELFSTIPDKLNQPRPTIDDGLSEYEGICHMEAIAGKNVFHTFDNYLGAGAYEHHIPAIVGAICSKSEFLTSYTPYQSEASQGMLQSIFEFQSAICALTGMDVSNGSLYDGASACSEALLMALRHHKERRKIVIAESLHPHYRGVVEQYLCSQGVEIATLPFADNGALDENFLLRTLDENTAAILVQYPNFLGIVEDLQSVAESAHKKGVLVIVCANPLVYGLYASAGELGADIAIGDGQPFGIPLQFGGPYVGYIACKKELVRQLPGRIVGETVDTKGRRGFVLTLQAREQHIRREKATSNICTNQALAALASLISMIWYGKKGVQKLALTNYQRASYLKNLLENLPGIEFLSSEPIFNEFAIKFPGSVQEVIHHFRKKKIEPGLDLVRYFPKLRGYILVAVTETKSKEQLNRYLEVAKECLI